MAALALVVAVAAAVPFILSGQLPSLPSPSATLAAAAPTPSHESILPPTPLAGSAHPSPESPTASPAPLQGIVAKRIRLARLSIDLPIIEGDGIDAPLNKAAHYPGTAWPDEGSNIYLYAHAQEGMFLTLWDVEVGDEVILDLVDGTTRTYRVSEIMPKAPWNAMELLDPTPTEQLTLQTSTSYLPESPRFVVIAVPVAAQ